MNLEGIYTSKYFVALTFSLIAVFLSGCKEKEYKQIREQIMVATPDWKDKKISNLCLSGVRYQYIDEVFVGGLTPKYENDTLVACDSENKAIRKSAYSYYKICLDGYWVHSLSIAKGKAYSVALDITGKPLKCELDLHHFVQPD